MFNGKREGSVLTCADRAPVSSATGRTCLEQLGDQVVPLRHHGQRRQEPAVAHAALVLQRHSATALQRHSVTALRRYSVPVLKVLQRRSVTALQRRKSYSVTAQVSQRYSVTES